MPAELLKFRCYRCNQLLAVAPSRAGSVVGCPRCKAELEIPLGDASSKGETDRAARRQRAKAVKSGAAPSQSDVQDVPPFMTEIAAAIPPEVADLRPEDLRVEAGVFESITREPPPPASAPPMPPAVIDIPLKAPFEDHKSELTPSELSNLFAPAPQPSEPSPAPIPPPPEPDETRTIVPSIEIEPPSIRTGGTEVRHYSEVILPASVVLAWSLFVLLGIASSFVAGLLVGHFLWRLH